MVAIDDAVGLVLFSVSFGIATALANGQINVLGVVVEPIVEIILSLGLGSAGKYFGSSISCRITQQPKPITDNLGITLRPQAGVALGMALTAASLPNGAMARNVVLLAVLIYELIGPALTKRSLLAVGEICPEGRVSARKHNEPKTR